MARAEIAGNFIHNLPPMAIKFPRITLEIIYAFSKHAVFASPS